MENSKAEVDLDEVERVLRHVVDHGDRRIEWTDEAEALLKVCPMVLCFTGIQLEVLNINPTSTLGALLDRGKSQVCRLPG